MNILLLTFGTNIRVHNQAHFLILSLLDQLRPEDHIHVYTDNPSCYGGLHAHHLHIETLTHTMLDDWKGPHHFFWRVKIKAIQHLLAKYPGNDLLYLDTDIVIFEMDPLYRWGTEGIPAMHLNEGPLCRLPSKTTSLMWKQCRGQTFGGITVTENSAMWNAGLVLLPGSLAKDLADTALAICDDMCSAGVTQRLIEQFALSIALQQSTEPAAAAPFVAHYWGNKEEWNEHIVSFFNKAWLSGQSLEERIKAVAGMPLKKIPVHKRRSSSFDKLYKLLQRAFPPKAIKYFDDFTS